MNKSGLIMSLIFSCLFFIISFITLNDYGISWDETLHFRRGQAYLHYYLTGNTGYNDLSENNYRRSYYQNDYHNGEYWLENDSGHPPLNGILAATSNYFFYQRLDLLSDISSYHLFNIISSTFLVFVVVFFSVQTLGVFPSLISFLTLSTYPLFWAESHFNIKDPPMTAFFAGCIWAFYNSVGKKSYKWLLLSYFFFALGVSIKFNMFFLPFILAIWLLFYFRSKLHNPKKAIMQIPRSYLITLFAVGPMLVAIIFIGSWPFLWQNFPYTLFKIFGYYKDMGTGFQYQPDSFYIFGFNTFPLQWIFYTTPPFVLLITAIGIISVFHNRKKNNVTLLWLIWLIIPIFRVTILGSTIYGGIRQIFEFIPAMALLSGLGAWQIIHWLKIINIKKLILIKILLITVFVWPIINLVNMHPYENVYFNFLINGLPGAKDRDFPSWGNTFGTAYKEGIEWINENVEDNAKLSLIQGTTANAPEIWIRKDINYINKTNFSGIDKKSEYVMELTFNDTGKSFHYVWEYVDKFLVPVHEVKVEGVTILKIWKNDLEHTRLDYKLTEKTLYLNNISGEVLSNIISYNLGTKVNLSKLLYTYIPSEACRKIENIFIETSLDAVTWKREKDWVPFPQVGNLSNLDENEITFHFAAREAKWIRLIADAENSCALLNPQIEVVIFK